MAMTPADIEQLIAEIQKNPQLRDRVRNAILAGDFLRLPATVERLADRMEGLVVEIGGLTTAVRELAVSVQGLSHRTSHLEGRVGNLDGDQFEARYARHVATHLARWFTGVREIIAGNEPTLLAALSSGILTDADWENLGGLDILAVGREKGGNGTETYVAIEGSAVVDIADVERAEARAALVRRAGLPAVAAVGGRSILPAAREAAEARGVITLVRTAA
jgi:hypothetical protein